MTHKPSKPGFELSGEPDELNGIVGERSAVRRQGMDLSAAEVFSATAQAIRRTRGDTGTLSLRVILPAQLAQSRFIQQFPEAAKTQWVDILTELMVTAKSCVSNGSTSTSLVSPVDFYQKYRRFLEEEESRPALEKLLFAERLADALIGAVFTFKEDDAVTQWSVILCPSDELAHSAAPSLLARSLSGETRKFKLLQVMGGLRAD